MLFTNAFHLGSEGDIVSKDHLDHFQISLLCRRYSITFRSILVCCGTKQASTAQILIVQVLLVQVAFCCNIISHWVAVIA